MAELMVFGLGFSASAFVSASGARFARITATQRRARRTAGVDTLAYDSAAPAPENVAALRDALASASHLLIPAPPDEDGDPVLRTFAADIADAPALRSVVYLSTIGVYGDHKGAVIDEDAELRAGSARNRRRIVAERQWLELGRASGKSVHVLRLAGIYGPGRNQLVKLRQGAARRIIREGQVFNRIHSADIAQAIDAAFRRETIEQRAWNVTDNEPCAPEKPIEFAASLLGIEPPPAIGFEEADFSPMARSFWGENKRVSNRRMREELGVTLRYPTYRDGLTALAAMGDGR